MNNEDRSAGHELLETAVQVPFRILETKIESSPGGEQLNVHIEIQFGIDVEDEPCDIAEWGSFGFIFTLAVLSFADARPRGVSSAYYQEDDEFGVGDFLKCLSFSRGELYFHADYIRGRSMKTEMTVRSDGRFSLATWGRGKAALHWLDRLQGKKPIQVL